MAIEERKTVRLRKGSQAWIKLDGGFSVRPCRIADLSHDGVQIEFDTPNIVADQFSLLLSRDTKSSRKCRVRWRKGRRIGAQFVKGSAA